MLLTWEKGYAPSSHSKQDMSCACALYVPGAQSEQNVCSKSTLNFPRGQERHCVAPALVVYVPLEQIVQMEESALLL